MVANGLPGRTGKGCSHRCGNARACCARSPAHADGRLAGSASPQVAHLPAARREAPAPGAVHGVGGGRDSAGAARHGQQLAGCVGLLQQRCGVLQRCSSGVHTARTAVVLSGCCRPPPPQPSRSCCCRGAATRQSRTSGTAGSRTAPAPMPTGAQALHGAAACFCCTNARVSARTRQLTGNSACCRRTLHPTLQVHCGGLQPGLPAERGAARVPAAPSRTAGLPQHSADWAGVRLARLPAAASLTCSSPPHTHTHMIACDAPTLAWRPAAS